GSELQKAKEELTRIKIGTTENLSQAGLRASETFPRKGTPALKTLNGPGSLAFWRGELQGWKGMTLHGPLLLIPSWTYTERLRQSSEFT
ncbi:unnamed protein product, partial [Effrenium voratum]